MVLISYFTRKAAAKETKRRAEICPMFNSPTIMLGGYRIVNKHYTGPFPYNGPEMTDPRNKDKDFIIIHGNYTPPPRPVSKPKPYSERSIRWAV